MQRICVFCGAHAGTKPAYLESARRLGGLLVERNVELVNGGGQVGMMGATADAVLAQGGRAIGVIPHGLSGKEIAHQDMTELHIVPNMHARKALMAKLSDGFIALPGGFGTLEELFEVTTWSQLGIHRKPIGLANVAGYYDPLLTMIDRAVEEGFIRPEYRQLLLSDSDEAALLDQMIAYRAPDLKRWITPDES